MAESTAGWFGMREKYYSLADKPWFISQIRPSEQAAPTPSVTAAALPRQLHLHLLLLLLIPLQILPGAYSLQGKQGHEDARQY